MRVRIISSKPLPAGILFINVVQPDPPKEPETAFVCLYAPALRAYVPCIPDNVWKFFTLVLAHCNEQGTTYVGTRAMWELGYHPKQQKPLFDAAVELGLLRVVQAAGRDQFGRWSSVVYQVNLALVRLPDPETAYGLGDAPFANLIPNVPSSEDQVNKHRITNYPSNADQVDLGQDGSQDASEYHRITNSYSNGDHKYNYNEVDKRSRNNVSRSREVEQRSKTRSASKTNYNTSQPTHTQQDERQQTSAQRRDHAHQAPPQAHVSHAQNATRKTAKQETASPTSLRQPSPPNPPPPTGKREKVDLSQYDTPFSDSLSESAAALLKSAAPDMRLQNARHYVAVYGAVEVRRAISAMFEAKTSGKQIPKPAGWIINALKGAAIGVTVKYRLDDRADCERALADTALSEDERENYRVALDTIHALHDPVAWYAPR